MAGGKEKKRGNSTPSVPGFPRAAFVSRRGWVFISLGVLVVAAGFTILSYSDTAGQNWASRLSPIVILSGYLGVGIGTLLKNPA